MWSKPGNDTLANVNYMRDLKVGKPSRAAVLVFQSSPINIINELVRSEEKLENIIFPPRSIL